jgi:hypothetical protein
MNAESRLKRIEESLATGECTCVPRRGGIWHSNCCRGVDCNTPHEPPPDYCETCGGAIASLEITYVEDWRGFHSGQS